MLKYFIIFSFGFFVTVQATFCTSQNECYDHECCVHTLLDRGKCKRRPKGANNCNLLAKIHNKENEMYKIDCMCPEGFECRLGELLIDKAPRCRKSKTTTEMPQTTTETVLTTTGISQTEVTEPTEKPDTEIENPEEPDTKIENPDTEIENPEETDKEPDTDIENEVDNFEF